MTHGIIPWTSATLAVLLAASWQARRRPDGAGARRVATAAAGIAGLLAAGAWLQFELGGAPLADPLDPVAWAGGAPVLVLDAAGALLSSLVAVLFGLLILSAPRAKDDPARSSRMLLLEATVLGLLATSEPIVLGLLWAALPFPLLAALRAGGPDAATAHRAASVYLHGGSALLLLGILLLEGAVRAGAPGWVLTVCSLPVAVAVMARGAIVPFHSWLPVVAERAPLGALLGFCLPQTGAYVALRLLAHPDGGALAGLLGAVGVAALLTSVYGAALALVQQSARRAFGFLVTSQSALVLAGLGSALPIGHLAALVCALSSGISLAGFGLTLRALEARRGALTLDRFHGGHDRMPTLAGSFAFLGLASVGLPATLGFVAAELLIRGTVDTYPVVGVAVVLAGALGGLTVMRAYWRLFCGARFIAGPDVSLRFRERVAIVVLVAATLLGGIAPAGLLSRCQDAVSPASAARVTIPAAPGH